jgi:hypothetical protein
MHLGLLCKSERAYEPQRLPRWVYALPKLYLKFCAEHHNLERSVIQGFGCVKLGAAEIHETEERRVDGTSSAASTRS